MQQERTRRKRRDETPRRPQRAWGSRGEWHPVREWTLDLVARHRVRSFAVHRANPTTGEDAEDDSLARSHVARAPPPRSRTTHPPRCWRAARRCECGTRETTWATRRDAWRERTPRCSRAARRWSKTLSRGGPSRGRAGHPSTPSRVSRPTRRRPSPPAASARPSGGADAHAARRSAAASARASGGTWTQRAGLHSHGN